MLFRAPTLRSRAAQLVTAAAARPERVRGGPHRNAANNTRTKQNREANKRSLDLSCGRFCQFLPSFLLFPRPNKVRFAGLGLVEAARPVSISIWATRRDRPLPRRAFHLPAEIYNVPRVYTLTEPYIRGHHHSRAFFRPSCSNCGSFNHRLQHAERTHTATAESQKERPL